MKFLTTKVTKYITKDSKVHNRDPLYSFVVKKMI